MGHRLCPYPGSGNEPIAQRAGKGLRVIHAELRNSNPPRPQEGGIGPAEREPRASAAIAHPLMADAFGILASAEGADHVLQFPLGIPSDATRIKVPSR